MVSKKKGVRRCVMHLNFTCFRLLARKTSTNPCEHRISYHQPSSGLSSHAQSIRSSSNSSFYWHSPKVLWCQGTVTATYSELLGGGDHSLSTSRHFLARTIHGFVLTLLSLLVGSCFHAHTHHSREKDTPPGTVLNYK